MAERRALPARTPRDRSRDDDSLLLRSAESLGRVIGALQRQLDEATRRLTPGVDGKGLDGKVVDGKSAAFRVDGRSAASRVDGKPAKAAAKRSRKTATPKRTTAKAGNGSTANDKSRRSPARKSRKTTKRR